MTRAADIAALYSQRLWTPASTINVSGVTAAEVAFPVGADLIRLSGRVLYTNAANELQTRLSFNNGSSYDSGSNYVYSYLYQNGSSVTGSNNLTVTTWGLQVALSNVGYAALFEMLLFVGDASRRPQYQSRAAALGASHHQAILCQGSYSGTDDATNLRFLLAGGGGTMSIKAVVEAA